MQHNNIRTLEDIERRLAELNKEREQLLSDLKRLKTGNYGRCKTIINTEMAQRVTRKIINTKSGPYSRIFIIFRQNGIGLGELKDLDACIAGEVDEFYGILETGHRKTLSNYYFNERAFNQSELIELKKFIKTIKEGIHNLSFEWDVRMNDLVL